MVFKIQIASTFHAKNKIHHSKYISSAYLKIPNTKYNVEKNTYKKIQMYFQNTLSKYIALILFCLTTIDSNLIKKTT